MTKRGDESEYAFRQTPSELVREKSKPKEKGQTPKKNILKLLEDLEDDEEDHLYKQEFESYREESEAYQ